MNVNEITEEIIGAAIEVCQWFINASDWIAAAAYWDLKSKTPRLCASAVTGKPGCAEKRQR
jgi:hypothetical protein